VRTPSAAETSRALRYTRIHSDEAGESSFLDEPVEGLLEWDARFVRLVRVPPHATTPLHPEPAPTLATVIAGSLVITTSDGSARRLEPGAAMLFLDVVGRGHAFTNGPDEALLFLARLAGPHSRRTSSDPADTEATRHEP
jgi:quercetin dioxygenase-like cupin family protein